jgi:GTPase SAR1 family protein
MQQYLRLLGRNAFVVNLDPANEGSSDDSNPVGSEEVKRDQSSAHQPAKNSSNNPQLPYETLFDAVQEAVRLSSVMEETGLGPNGGLIYCMEYLEAHADAVIDRLDDLIRLHTQESSQTPYLIFDFPGQVELYTHSTCVQTLLEKLSRRLDLRLTAVQLIDAQYCTDPSKFLSAALLATTTMLRLELPMVNVLSKVDVLYSFGDEGGLPMQLEFFTECSDLDRLLPFLDNPMSRAGDDDFDIADDPEYQRARRKRRQSKLFRKFEKLHAVMAEVVDDFGLLSFIPLCITSAESVGRVLARIDKCNGYVFMGNETSASIPQDMFQCAIQSDSMYEALAEVQERISYHANE